MCVFLCGLACLAGLLKACWLVKLHVGVLLAVVELTLYLPLDMSETRL